MIQKLKKTKDITVLIIIIFFWSLLLLYSTHHEIELNNDSIESIAKHEAKIAYKKDMLYREWASKHGGVYVPITQETPPNPWLSHIVDRNIKTPSGIKLTLVNANYMIRQVHELGEKTYSLQGHLTSLNPIDPMNAPDPWERKALEAFKTGVTEISEFVEIDGVKHLRFISAFVTEESCLKCLSNQGYKIGDIRGGISVIVDMSELELQFSKSNSYIVVRHILIWLTGFASILLMSYMSKKRFNNQELYTKNLAKAKFDAETEKEHLSVTLKSIGEGVITTNILGKITKMNQIAQSLTGWSYIETQEEEISSVFVTHKIDETEKRVDILYELIQNQNTNVIKGNYILHSKNGEIYNIYNSGSVIRSQEGEIIGVVLVFRDITKENNIQKELNQKHKLDAIGQLTSGIAHDFNNMIGGIMGGTELLQNHLKGDEKSQKYLSLIMKSSKRASDLTAKLRSFSKSQSIDIKPIDLHGAITSAVSLMENTLNKNVDIHVNLNAESSITIGELSQLQNIFINLGINSSHAMPNGGYFTITTSNIVLGDITYIKIEVEDNGNSITKEVLPHIFDPFFTTKNNDKGTGLGLSVTYGTIKKLDGQISVQSTINIGTIFTILFPITELDLPKDQNISTVSYQGNGTILLVDDEEILRTVGHDILEELGYNVIVAIDGIHALKIFKENNTKIDLIILDMIMPKMSGRECFIEIKKLDPQMPIVIASGYSNNGDIDQLKELNCNGFISKPYSIPQISKLVSEILNT